MIDEYASAVTRFTDDLWAIGIPLHQLDKTKGLYSTALFEPSNEAWTPLYQHVSKLLQQWLKDWLEPAAARRVLAFIDDDFAKTVLDLPIRMRVHDLLSRHRVAR